MAVLSMKNMGIMQPVDPTDDTKEAVEWRRVVKRLTDYFDADVKAAVQKVKQS